MSVSYSKVNCYLQCPYQYKLKYIEGLKCYPKTEADNALWLGTAMHEAIQTGDVKKAVENYYAKFPIIDDLHIIEAMKIEALYSKCRELVGGREWIVEHKIERGGFIGFIDLLVKVDDTHYDMYDFKYANASNAGKYLESGQMHIYKHFFELNGEGRIRNMYYLIAPKVGIRPKKTETQEVFRKRLKMELVGKTPTLLEVKFDLRKVADFLSNSKLIELHNEAGGGFEKRQSRLCDWCDYQGYCEKGDDLNIMNLPKNERKKNPRMDLKKIWLYGLPFSGKTHLANAFPNVLMLNTDGNIKYYDAPFISIKDEVQADGRLTKRVFAWDKLKDTILELEKQDNTFETIVVDLLEDTYEHCRLYCYDKLGIEHESDNSFKAWDFVRTEFLSTIKRLLNLNYNIVLISHEDTSKDVTRKNGDKITAIKPNIGDKIALKIAGMVDFIARVINDNGERVLSFKTNEVVFGGGRIAIADEAYEVVCDYTSIEKLYEGAKEKQSKKASKPSPALDKGLEEGRYFKRDGGGAFILPDGANFSDIGEDEAECDEISEEEYKKIVAKSKPIEAEAEAPAKRRTRRTREEVPAEKAEAKSVEVPSVEEKAPAKRRVRKTRTVDVQEEIF